MKRLKQFIVAAFTMFTMFTPALVPAVAHAEDIIKGNLCQGVNFDTNSTCATDAKADPKAMLKKVVQWAIIIIGSISVIMIIFGGFKYITSGGDSNNVTAAKNTIMYALIGLIIVLFAQGIVSFVLKEVQV